MSGLSSSSSSSSLPAAAANANAAAPGGPGYAAPTAARQSVEELKRTYTSFLSDQEMGQIYQNKLSQVAADDKFRFILNVNDLRTYNREFAAE
jgi:hypothetical protein